MDTFALGLRVAYKMIEDNFFENIMDENTNHLMKALVRK